MPTDIEEKFHRLERLLGKIEANKASRPKIQRVPEYMATREEFKKYYLPQIISIGPIHGQSHLRDLGRSHKYTWTAMYTAEHANGKPRSLYERVVSGNEELKEQCDVENWSSMYDEWDLLLDGCSVLQVLGKSDHSVDPVQDLKISMDKLVRMHQDLLILDNQVPFKVLRLLCSDEARLNECLHNFLEVHGVKMAHMHRIGKPVEGSEDNVNAAIVEVDDTQDGEDDDDDPVHLLDYLRRSILMRDLGQIHREVKFNRTSWHLRKYRIGTIQELKAAGIRVRKHPNNTSFYPIFNDGKLLLPELTIDGSTAHIFLNQIAYEMCPDFVNNCEISSFVVLMNSLIDHPGDVRALRSAGVLINELASDKQVADLFNKMDIVLVPETAAFAHIRDQIHSHFESKRGKIKMLGWVGEAYSTYFRSPWSIIALLTCSIGLVLSFLQTWFAIHPKG